MTSKRHIQFQAVVQDLNYQGNGVIHHPQGKVFFVRGLWPEEEALFEIEASSLEDKRVSFAKPIQMIRVSKHRVQTECEHQGFEANHCQGCSWMMIDYPAQLQAKQERVLMAMQNAELNFASAALKTIWPSEQTLGYRNRVQFKTDGRNLGLISPEDHSLVPLQSCVVLTPKLQKSFKKLHKALPNPKWFIKPNANFHTLEFDEDISVDDVIPNQRRPFKQGHDLQNKKMKAWLHDKMQHLDRTLPVLELFCGSGNLTEVLVDLKFKNVAAIESDSTAIFSLKQKGFEGVQALSANLYDSASFAILQRQFGRREILVLDPPREGLQSQALKLLQTFPKISEVFYISCDPESWAKDVSVLQKTLGLKLIEVQPIDLFPQTPHVEILSILSKSM